MTSRTFTNADPVIALRHVGKAYPGPAAPFHALSDVTLTIARGTLAAVVGQSGSGKSTLLSIMSGVERPSAGEVIVDGTPIHALTERQLSAWRGRRVGIVFQFFQLLPTLTALENVMLPMDFCDVWPARERRDRAAALMERLGVADQARKLPGTLSGGQQQRVAIARALANAPAVLLADEPTGNLDSRTAASILEMLRAVSNEGQTVVVVTHEPAVQRVASQTISIADGRIEAQSVVAHA